MGVGGGRGWEWVGGGGARGRLNLAQTQYTYGALNAGGKQ